MRWTPTWLYTRAKACSSEFQACHQQQLYDRQTLLIHGSLEEMLKAIRPSHITIDHSLIQFQRFDGDFDAHFSQSHADQRIACAGPRQDRTALAVSPVKCGIEFSLDNPHRIIQTTGSVRSSYTIDQVSAIKQSDSSSASILAIFHNVDDTHHIYNHVTELHLLCMLDSMVDEGY